MRFTSFVKSCVRVACGFLIAFAEQAQGNPGAVDPSFDPSDWLSQYPQWQQITVANIVRQRDGRLLVNYLGHQSSKWLLVRLNPNGQKDTGFAASSELWIQSPVELPNGRILVRIGGKLQRLSDTGELDASFSVDLNDGSYLSDFAVQPDGKIVIAGLFETVDGVVRRGIARLFPNGRLDPSFEPDPSRSYADGETKLVLQPDGRVITSTFRAYPNSGGSERSLLRLNIDGSLDTSFSVTLHSESTNLYVFALACQPDGKLLVGGRFLKTNGIERRSLVRLNENGELDSSFNPGAGLQGGDVYGVPTVNAISVLADGRVVVGGTFATVNGQPHPGLVRFLPDGAVDSAFVPGPRTPVSPWEISSLLALPDGKLLIGGSFTAVEDVPTRSIARLLGGDLPQPGIGQASFAWSEFHMNEAEGEASISVRRTDGTSGTLTVAYETIDGTAIAGRDYTSAAGSLVFGDGEATKQIRIPVINDSVGFEARRFKVRLIDPAQGTAVGGTAETTVIIHDDELPTIFQMSVASFDVRETAGTAAIRVRRTGSAGASAKVTYEALSGSAKSGEDFVPAAGELVFLEGELEKTISVTLLEDESVEEHEDFQVRLTGVPIGGRLGSLVSTTVTIVDSHEAGALDDTFQPVMAGPNRSVQCLLVQTDGKVIVGGSDLGASGGISLLRLNPDGAVDPTFLASSQVPTVVNAIATQPDGKLVVAGFQIDSANHSHKAKVVRLDADGTLDPTFSAGEMFMNAITCLAILPNGQIVVGGLFDFILNVDTRPRFLRLESNGSIDPSFRGLQLGEIKDLVRMNDGSIVVAGYSLYKLTPAGVVDSGFHPPQMKVSALEKDSKGRILVSGTEGTDTASIKVVRRLLPDGAIDESFAAATDLLGPAEAFAVLPDGRILAAGTFKTYSGVSCGPVIRLLPDGTLDPTFSTLSRDTDGQPTAIGYSLDGNVFVGGQFSSLNDISAPGIARLRGGIQAGSYFRFERTGFDVQEETAGKFQVRVLRLGTVEDAAEVKWTVEKGGSGISADNYIHTGQLDFAPGVRVQTIELEVNDDHQFEPDEFFAVSLREPTSGVVLATPASIRIGVRGAEPPSFGTFQLAAETLKVSENDGTAEVVVLRTNGSYGQVSVSYTTVNETAVAGRDFTAVRGILTFADGQTSRTITIPLTQDILAEPDRSFRVIIDGPTGGAALGGSVSTRVLLTDSDKATLRVFRGSYRGSILADSGATAVGRISMTLSVNGGVTATVLLRDKSYQFRGRFDERGQLEILIPAKPSALRIRLSIDTSGESAAISGELEQGGLVAEIESKKAVFQSQKNPAFAAGAYTVFCEPASTGPVIPSGTGFATVKVSRSGLMRWTGRLADGQPVSVTGVIDESGTCFFYALLAKSRGSLAGELHFAQSGERDCLGEAQWSRNGTGSEPVSAFSAGLELTGSAFAPSKRTAILPWNQGTVSLSGGAFPALPPIAIQQSGLHRFVSVPAYLGLSLSVDPASGLLRGRFQHPITGATVSLNGAVLTDEGRAAGYFLAPEPGGFEMKASDQH